MSITAPTTQMSQRDSREAGRLAAGLRPMGIFVSVLNIIRLNLGK